MPRRPSRPPRLSRIFQSDAPLYFVTLCTAGRRPVLACDEVVKALDRYAQGGLDRGVGLGRYVVMPDHLHLFVRVGRDVKLGEWVKGLKRAITIDLKKVGFTDRLWQPGFFDHLLRGSESYAEKWKYVQQNPARAGLVVHAEEWPYQAEFERIDRV